MFTLPNHCIIVHKYSIGPVSQLGVSAGVGQERKQYALWSSGRPWTGRAVHYSGRRHKLQANSKTNQLAVSQVADWITRGLVNSLAANL